MAEAMQLNSGVLMVAGPSVEPVPVVSIDSTIEDALFQLERVGRDELLVVNQSGRLTGVVSESQLSRAIPQIGTHKDRSIKSLLTARFGNETQPQTMWQANAVHAGDEMRCQPVLQDGRLVSLLTDDDFFVSWRQVAGLLSAAAQDQLTELASRPTFLRRFDEEWERARRRQSPLAVLLIDLDEFKLVNDICGHLVGDRVLSQVGACLRKQLRSYDIVGRLGGDEFAALCCDCHPDDVLAPIARLRAAVRELPVPPQLNRDSFSLSVGAAVVCSGFELLSTEALIEAADEALYASKRAGRDAAFRMVLNRNGSEISRELTELDLEVAVQQF